MQKIFVLGLLWALVGCTSNNTLPTVASLPTTTTAEPTFVNTMAAMDETPLPTTPLASTPTVPLPIATFTPRPVTATPDLGTGITPREALLPLDLQGAGFAVDIRDMETVRISGAGVWQCEADRIVLATAPQATAPYLSLSLPKEIVSGSYRLTDFDAVRPQLLLTSGTEYDINVNGTLWLVALPQEGSTTVQGDFQYTVGDLNAPTLSITVRGGFNFTATSCPN